MTYLGVEFDTVKMQLNVDPEKLSELKLELSKWVRRTVAKKCEMQSILGKLLWVSRTVRFSRVFVARIIAEIRKLEKQSDKTVLSRDIRKDFLWWLTFIEIFNGVELIPSPSVNIAVYGDACVIGGGGWNPQCSEFFSVPFPEELSSPDTPIHIKEFFILILSIKSWGHLWSGHRVVLYCDNDSVCDTCVHQKPKDLKMQQLLREFLYWICRFNFYPVVEKIGTKDNHLADYLSRVYDHEMIKTYFSSNGFTNCTRIHISKESFNFVADW